MFNCVTTQESFFVVVDIVFVDFVVVVVVLVLVVVTDLIIFSCVQYMLI